MHALLKGVCARAPCLNPKPPEPNTKHSATTKQGPLLFR